jgi:hypothetical protein
MTDARVDAIRAHPLVGEGSCTTVDEALTDGELVEWLDEAGATTVEEAIAEAIDFEDLHMEKALNCRWGEDDDPQLKMYEDWQERKAEHGAS